MKQQVDRGFNQSKLWAGLLLPACIIGLMHVFAYPNTTWKLVYVHRVYPMWSMWLRALLGWIPFSVGDILYVVLGAGILRSLCQLFLGIIRKQRKARLIATRVLRLIVWMYALFLIQWGYNYHIHRVRRDFGIVIRPYSQADLVQLCDSLAARTNRFHKQVSGSDTAESHLMLPFDSLRTEVLSSYLKAAKEYPELQYKMPSLKASMLGSWLNYAGVTGYYNPFTGEAQVNVSVPELTLPFSACHEVAHQIGFAPEQAANFIGYVVANRASNPWFKYSANSEVLLYALQKLSWENDSLARKLAHVLVSAGVLKDYQSEFAFYQQYTGSFQSGMNAFYDQYLKANEQQKGMESYDDVVSLLMAYTQKYGHLPD